MISNIYGMFLPFQERFDKNKLKKELNKPTICIYCKIELKFILKQKMCLITSYNEITMFDFPSFGGL